ncbi:hypothetical protein [Bifidobacterium avesanii]|uniref:Histidine kinase n=1 Tax=Bifidobacterium avesanii TaxID=1798157 RepID=A0A7K3TGN2_9BIFI|nr:hypothetical protein [Bifidobacterium avesanii]KAB8293612.1 hypothetical protein DSM100685_0680 [Bifidobacterium avesanii]NEG78251.1 hypothetical protein [Bifidobacterium avesanii]
MGGTDEMGGTGGAPPRWRRWWREPHFLERTRMLGVALWVCALLVVQPHSALDAAAVLVMLAVIVLLPAAPRVMAPVGLAAALAACFAPGGGTTLAVTIALFAVFLTAGYVCSARACVPMVAGYAVAEVTCGVLWGASSAAVEGLTGFVDGFAAETGGSFAGAGGVSPWLVWPFAVALSCLVSGFLALFGHSFRRNAVAGERLARSEAMVGRLTREQQLAHLIHDSVANDMSVIAMLAWRAKTGPGMGGGNDASAADGDAGSGADLDAALDAIYERSHHVLDRVHEVIDVLDGKRALADLDGSDGSGGSDAGMQAENGSTEVSEPVGLAGFVAELERYLEDQDRVMAMVGMSGVSRVTVEGDGPDRPVPPPQVRRAVLGFVEEVYANVVRHAAWEDAPDGRDGGSGNTYSLFVTVEPHRVRIAEVNAIGDGASAAVRGTRHGRGLALQRETIASLGGTLNAAAQDGTWTVAAEIPIR